MPQIARLYQERVHSRFHPARPLPRRPPDPGLAMLRHPSCQPRTDRFPINLSRRWHSIHQVCVGSISPLGPVLSSPFSAPLLSSPLPTRPPPIPKSHPQPPPLPRQPPLAQVRVPFTSPNIGCSVLISSMRKQSAKPSIPSSVPAAPPPMSKALAPL